MPVIPIHVIVDSWPSSITLFERMIPILIAVGALAASLYSTRQTRIHFIKAHRPYVHIIDPATIDNSRNVIRLLHIFHLTILNVPIKIKQADWLYEMKDSDGQKRIVCKGVEKNIVRFPKTPDTQFTFESPEVAKILFHKLHPEVVLTRTVNVIYTPLHSPRKHYRYFSKSEFTDAVPKWKSIDEIAT